MARATCQDCPWTATGALVAVSDQAEDHERSEMHDVTIKRIATDGGLPTTPGSWVKTPTHDGEWHASVRFDGYDHTTGCNRTLRAPDDIADVSQAAPEVADTIEFCADCLDHVDADHDPRLVADGGRPSLPYADLEWEDHRVVEAAVDRLETKAEKYGPQAYQDTDPLDHVQRAEEKLSDLRRAGESMDLEAGRVAAADAYNHLLMALTNIPEQRQTRADGLGHTGVGGFAAQPEPEPEPESATDDLASAVRDHPPGKPHHCDICDSYHETIAELVDHACEEHKDGDGDE